MRKYYLSYLQFLTPVHFGDAGAGGSLADVLPICHADTLFSALCSEAAGDEELLSWLVDNVSRGDILFSSLLPWYRAETGSDIKLYVPRPMLSGEAKAPSKKLDFAAMQAESGARKKLKKRTILRASELAHYADEGMQAKLKPLPNFGAVTDEVRFNSRMRKPYNLGAYSFAPEAGLYLVITAVEGLDIAPLLRLIALLGLSGIGGRRSSGLGKFGFLDAELESFVTGELSEAFIELSEDPVYGDDDAALYQLLIAESAEKQVTLAPLLPEPGDIDAIASGQLLRRGGFTSSPSQPEPQRTGSIYMLSEGACCSRRIAGRIASVEAANCAHSVFKYGKGLYLGVNA